MVKVLVVMCLTYAHVVPFYLMANISGKTILSEI